MNLKDKIIELLNLNDGSVYAIVTKQNSLLDSLSQTIRENTNTDSKSKVLGVNPLGVLGLPANVKIIFFDDTTTEYFLNTFCKDKVFVKFNENGDLLGT